MSLNCASLSKVKRATFPLFHKLTSAQEAKSWIQSFFLFFICLRSSVCLIWFNKSRIGWRMKANRAGFRKETTAERWRQELAPFVSNQLLPLEQLLRRRTNRSCTLGRFLNLLLVRRTPKAGPGQSLVLKRPNQSVSKWFTLQVGFLSGFSLQGFRFIHQFAFKKSTQNLV